MSDTTNIDQGLKAAGDKLRGILEKRRKGKKLNRDEADFLLSATGEKIDGKPPPRFAKTKVELADLLAVSRSTVERAFLIDGCPKAEANGRHHVERWRSFIAKHFDVLQDSVEGGAVPPGGFATWQEFTTAQKGMRDAVKLARERNQVADKPFVAQVIARGYNQLFATQSRVFLAELPAQLAGLDAVIIETKIREALTASHEEFKSKLSEWEKQAV